MFRCTRKGQIFPFLIAVICVLVILTMITVNLGQIGIFKTDISNAADAGALAGASVLSQTLLGLGLRSDMMCGRAIEVIIAILIELLVPIGGWIAAVITYIVFIIEAFVNLAFAYGDARMGWTNAKKTAVQYAFTNAGVDEPRPTFEEFLLNAYGISNPDTLTPAQLQAYYDEYMRGETMNYRNYAQSGFSTFLADGEGGYWDEGEFGAVDPGETSDVEVISGYGWNDVTGNSYFGGGDPRGYENWVEVKVMGNSQYNIDLWSALQEISQCLVNWLLDNIEVVWWLTWMGVPVMWIIETFASQFLCAMTCQYILPMGLQFGNREDITSNEDEDTIAEVDDNPILVEVIRYKREKDLGLWNFRYGETKAMAQSHAFRQMGDEYITPTCYIDIFGCRASWQDWFETRTHLFETELEYAY